MAQQQEPPSAVQSMMARGAVQWSLREAASAAQISVNTLRALEQGTRPTRAGSVAKLREAYEAEGCEFIQLDTVRWRGQ